METKDEHNKVRELELAYGRSRTLSLGSEEYRRLKAIAEESYAKDFMESPIPYTREELNARIAVAEAEIEAGVSGITTEELFENIERANPWLRNMETKDESNKVNEPELAYGRRRKTVDEMVEAIRREHPERYADDPDFCQRIVDLAHPTPMTREEYRNHIAQIQKAIDAGDQGKTSEEVFRDFERENPWLLEYL